MSQHPIHDLKYLAQMVSYIDMDKNRGGGDIEPAIITCRQILDEMKMDMLDIGELPMFIDAIDAAQSDLPKGREKLQRTITDTHNEIERLAGKDAHLIYAREVAA